jgi:hypothetical protein
MALVKLKPTSPGRRGMVKVVNPDLHKGRPFAGLVEKQSKSALKLDYPEIGPHIRQSIAFLAMSGAFETILENLSKSIICSPGRNLDRRLRVAIAFVNTIQWRNCSLKGTCVGT